MTGVSWMAELAQIHSPFADTSVFNLFTNIDISFMLQLLDIPKDDHCREKYFYITYTLGNYAAMAALEENIPELCNVILMEMIEGTRLVWETVGSGQIIIYFRGKDNALSLKEKCKDLNILLENLKRMVLPGTNPERVVTFTWEPGFYFF